MNRVVMQSFLFEHSEYSDIAFLEQNQHIHNIGVQRLQRSRCFVRTNDPPKDDGHIGGGAAEVSRDAKFLV